MPGVGFLTHSFGHIDPQIAKRLDEVHSSRGAALESLVPPATAADIKALIQTLSLKSEDDLLSLSFSYDLCSEVKRKSTSTDDGKAAR